MMHLVGLNTSVGRSASRKGKHNTINAQQNSYYYANPQQREIGAMSVDEVSALSFPDITA